MKTLGHASLNGCVFHLLRRAIRVIASVEPIEEKQNGFFAQVLMPQKVYECGVTRGAVLVVGEAIMRILVPVGIDTRSPKQIFAQSVTPELTCPFNRATSIR